MVAFRDSEISRATGFIDYDGYLKMSGWAKKDGFFAFPIKNDGFLPKNTVLRLFANFFLIFMQINRKIEMKA